MLIAGPSGRGKSALALRLIRTGARLVSDDYSHVWASAGALYARAPDAIAGRIEVRGVGIATEPAVRLVRVVLWVEASDRPIERMPAPETIGIAGLILPRLRLDLLHPAAAEAVRRAAGA